MSAQTQSRRSEGGPSAGKKLNALGGPQQQGGPVSENPNSVRGKGSQLGSQRKAAGLDRPKDGDSEAADKSEPTGKKPTVFVGKSGMVHTQGGDLNLRKGPGTDSAVVARLPLGSPLECTVAKGKWLKVTAWPGGTATEGYVHSGYVKEQPGLDKPDKKGDTDDRTRYIYKKMEGKAFQGAPSVDDVKQGSLGDCYLITALGAIATTAGGKEHLKKMVTPHGTAKTYTVKFQKKVKGKTETITKKVDTWFPTQNGDLRYALKPSKTFNKPLKDMAMWPAIVEKAYAAWQGSYDDIESGHAEEAIGEMTGLSSKETPLSDIPKDDDLLAAIKAAIKRGEAVTASSLYKAPRDLSGQMSGSGLGPYTAKGDAAKVVEKSVRLSDGNATPSAPSVRDDGKGKLSSPPAGPTSKKASGTVDYKNAKFSVTYPKGAGPAADSDLDLTYKAYGKISTNPLVYGRHAYIVRGMKGDKIDLFNPWNSSHPGAVDIATFRKLFRKFTNSVMPDGTTK